MKKRIELDGPQRLLTKNELQSYLKVGRTSAEKFGVESGAALKIGARILYDLEKIDQEILRRRGQA